MLQHERDTWTDLCAKLPRGKHPGESLLQGIGYVAKPHAVGGGQAAGGRVAWRLDGMGDVAAGIMLRW